MRLIHELNISLKNFDSGISQLFFKNNVLIHESAWLGIVIPTCHVRRSGSRLFRVVIGSLANIRGCDSIARCKHVDIRAIIGVRSSFVFRGNWGNAHKSWILARRNGIGVFIFISCLCCDGNYQSQPVGRLSVFRWCRTNSWANLIASYKACEFLVSRDKFITEPFQPCFELKLILYHIL